MPRATQINGDRRSSTDDETQPGSSNDQPTASESSGSYQAGGTNPQQQNGYPAQVDGHSVQVNGHPVQVNGHPVQVNGHPVQVNGHPVQVNGHPVQVNAAADSSREMAQPEPSASESLASDTAGLGEVGGVNWEPYYQGNTASNAVGHQEDAVDLSVRPWSLDYTAWLRQDRDIGYTHSENLNRLSQWSLDFRIVLYHVYPRHTWPLAKALMWQNLKNNIDATGMKVQRLILLTYDTCHKEELESVLREIDSL